MKTLNTILTVAIITLSINCFAGNNNKMVGTYTIGNNTEANFKTVAAAFTALEQSGANGPVTFMVDINAYNPQAIMTGLAKSTVSTNILFVKTTYASNVADISDDATALLTK